MNKRSLLVCLFTFGTVFLSNANPLYWPSWAQRQAAKGDQDKNAAQNEITKLKKEIADLRKQLDSKREEGETPENYKIRKDKIRADIKYKEAELEEAQNEKETGKLVQEAGDRQYAEEIDRQEKQQAAAAQKSIKDDASEAVILREFDKLDPIRAAALLTRLKSRLNQPGSY